MWAVATPCRHSIQVASFIERKREGKEGKEKGREEGREEERETQRVEVHTSWE